MQHEEEFKAMDINVVREGNVTPSHSRLAESDELELERAREWIKGHFVTDSELKYASIEGKLRVVTAILAGGWVKPSDTWKLQSLGVAIGDAMAQALMLDWVVVEDELGRDVALNWPSTSLYLFPKTMISKRVEQGVVVDVKALFERMCAQLREDAFSGRFL